MIRPVILSLFALWLTRPAYALKMTADSGSPEEEACQQQNFLDSHKSATHEPDPEVQGGATPGERSRMPAFEGLHYQLFLPADWKAEDNKKYPVVVFLHGSGDGKFSTMNSQSLPRLLKSDQSTSFDSRKCWCLDSDFAKVTAKKETDAKDKAFLDEDEDLHSPLADCSFAEKFGAIVVMPQGWLPHDRQQGWSFNKLQESTDKLQDMVTTPDVHRVAKLTQHVIQEYRGDSSRVILTGQSAGGAGAWKFATAMPHIWSAVNVICAPTGRSVAPRLEGVPVWVVGWAGDGKSGNDAVVTALKQRNTGSVRYTRYAKAPPPPDPAFSNMKNHGSYDLIYRDPRLWEWAFAQQNTAAAEFWSSQI